ncbi:MAG: Clp protease N-terminal domain-containing protein, partial [Nevskiales bacterium]
MRMDKLTSRLQSALADAQSLAVGRDHTQIEPVHLLLALLNQQGGSITPLLSQTGINLATLRAQLNTIFDGLARLKDSSGEVSFSQELGRILNVADKLSQERKDQFISSELVLLAMAQDKG